MAVAGAVMGAVSTVSSISNSSKQARAQREQIAIQEQSLKDQKLLSDISLREQERQLQAQSVRDSIMNNQAKTLGLLQLNLQESQQAIEAQHQQLQRSQSIFATEQRKIQREVESSAQLRSVMQALEQRVKEATAAGDKQGAEEANLALNRMAQSGFNFSQTSQTDQALNERMLLNQGTQQQALQQVDGVIETEKQQLAYENSVAELEQKLAQMGIDYNSLTQENQRRLGALYLEGSKENINNQYDRNTQASEYARQSNLGNISLQRATSNASLRSQLSTLDSQKSSVKSPGFADVLGAVGGLGLQLYDAGVFSRPTQPTTPYRVMSNYQVTDLRTQPTKWTNGILFPETRNFERPLSGATMDYTGANDLIKGFS